LEHKQGNGAIFTKKYNATDLIYYETFTDSKLARRREKQLKNWHKNWKWNLIKLSNPDLKTLEIK
jgi:putative endonuclease